MKRAFWLPGPAPGKAFIVAKSAWRTARGTAQPPVRRSGDPLDLIAIGAAGMTVAADPLLVYCPACEAEEVGNGWG